jgi:predicted RNA binding protein YcfA (HicA-like mRNA interferase family)
MIPPHLLQQLRNTPVRELVRALERDGFTFRRRRGAGRLYRHPDGRRALIHYHSSSDTLPIGTLRNVLAGTRWTEDDLRRLDLLS